MTVNPIKGVSALSELVLLVYTAMMLKYLGATNFDILEANDRIGGRCYTQALSGDSKYHNYYDVGAMRIPEVPWMQSQF